MRAIVLVMVFIVTFVISFPKDRVYHLLINSLESYDIQLQSKDTDISALGIDMKNSEIYMSQSQVGYIDSIDIGLFSMKMENVRFQNSVKQMVPDIKELNLFLSLGEFLNISGKFGSIAGTIDLGNRKIVFVANIKDSIYKKYKNAFGVFKKVKNKKGEYIYELNI